MSNAPIHPALAEGLQKEIVAALMMAILHHSGDDELIQNAISPNPDFEKLHAHLVRHNEMRHAELMTGQKPAAQPAMSRAQRVNHLLSRS